MYNMYPYPFEYTKTIYKRDNIKLKDYGPNPIVIDIEDATKQNNTFRTTLWTGENLQVTLMSIDVGDEIGLEVHTTGDQFIRIEDGDALVQIGNSQDNLSFQKKISDDHAVMIPAGKWHNIINIGSEPLKLYAIYAPPEHPKDTIQPTKADAEAAGREFRY
ncbi:cupin domain-containing protein [Terrisporobacter petrolearius]